MTTRELLERGVGARLEDPHTTWFARAVERAARGTSADLLQIYTDASRQLGRAPLDLDTSDSDESPDFSEVRNHWTMEDAGRLVFLLVRYDGVSSADTFAADAVACFEQGDTREQQSWLRGAALLPEPATFLPLVIDACRTNILPLFEAVACENPYPARHFPDRNFNQLVLKALFNAVALARIVGLSTRANPELARMAGDYAAERQAAGRSIPVDISLAMTQRTDR